MQLKSPFSALIQRKHLLAALAAGGGAAAWLALTPNDLSPLMRALTAWDSAAAAYIVALFLKMRGATPEHLAERAAATDEGRNFVLLVSLLAVIASVAAIGMELASGRSSDVPFVLLTLALSWLFVHLTFALHYAHEYYGPADAHGKSRHGLKFPGNKAPDFWDFVHFALVIGVANQTADVQIESKTIRRVATLHGIAAFLFNTVILAMAINLAAGLFK